MHCKRDVEGNVRKLTFVFDDEDVRYCLGHLFELESIDDEDLEEISDGVCEKLAEGFDWDFERYVEDMYGRVCG